MRPARRRPWTFAIAVLAAAVAASTFPAAGGPESALAACQNAAAVRREADYIVRAQYSKTHDPASGAINNVFGAPTWIVPRENATAILGLARASECLGTPQYLQRAEQAANYLVRVQQPDGGWYDQYAYVAPVVLSKSPTQTAEVMLALHRLGYRRSRYASMVNAAEFLLRAQDPANKGGVDDGLLGGGIDERGVFRSWRWASDNAYAYQALRSAELWARTRGDVARADRYATASSRILGGINSYLKDPVSPVWHVAIDGAGVPTVSHREWINYAPQMLDVPADGVGPAVGTWISQVLVESTTGAAVWNDADEADRRSPGFSFQACLVWQDTGQQASCDRALRWAAGSGLHQTSPDANGVSGGWVDWAEADGTIAPNWQRFIDTSAYYILVTTGGYRFGP